MIRCTVPWALNIGQGGCDDELPGFECLTEPVAVAKIDRFPGRSGIAQQVTLRVSYADIGIALRAVEQVCQPQPAISRCASPDFRQSG